MIEYRNSNILISSLVRVEDISECIRKPVYISRLFGQMKSLLQVDKVKVISELINKSVDVLSVMEISNEIQEYRDLLKK